MYNFTKRIFSLLVSLMLILTFIPANVLAEGTQGSVYVTVENLTFTDGAVWTGKKLDMYEVSIDENDTIMDATIKALEENSLEAVGAESNYISSIAGLGEMDGGDLSGWMVSLNDWFISAGAESLYVQDGDIICWHYSCNFGEDIGSSWNNTDTALETLSFSEGSLDKEFASDVYDYTLTLSEDVSSVTVTPSAVNKNYQTRIYKNTTVNYSDETGYEINGERDCEDIISGFSAYSPLPKELGYYKRSREIPVESGDILTIACGLPYWSSMNSPAEGQGHIYTVKILVPINVSVGIFDYTASTYNESAEIKINATENGIISDCETVTAFKNATALDVLKQFFDSKEIPYTVNNEYNYITSVNNLSEFDCGSESGWIFSINDDFSNMGANSTIVSDGDIIKLHYSVKGWGTDVGNYFEGGPVIENLILGEDITAIDKETVLSGEGTKENPYIVNVTLSTGSDITNITSQLKTSLHPEYLCLSTENGYTDITQPADYTNEVKLCIETPGGFKKTYYTIKAELPENSNSEGSENSGSDDNSGSSNSSGSSSSSGSSGGSGGGSKKTQSANKEEEKDTQENKEALNNESIENSSAESGKTFNDTENHWAEKYIKELTDKGIIKGKNESEFAPDDNITRAEYITILYRISNSSESFSQSFSDVSESDWFFEAVCWAVNSGITNGINDKEFAPYDNITREQAAAFMVRFTKYMNLELSEYSSDTDFAPFKDETLFSDWAKESILIMQDIGILNGNENGEFAPLDNATRAETAKIISEFLRITSK